MKKHCAGLAVVVLSLVALGVANAQIAFHGVVNPNTHTVAVDSAIIFISPTANTYPTPGWGGTSIDTFDFPNIARWPDSVELFGTIDLGPNVSMFASPIAHTWYRFNYGGIVAPEALFFETAADIGEPKPMTGSLQRLTVNPSVVTEQMTIRLQSVGTSRPVVEIHDAIGNVVRSLTCTAGANGAATTTWSREDDFGRSVPEGVYFCRYAGSGAVAVRKILVTH